MTESRPTVTSPPVPAIALCAGVALILIVRTVWLDRYPGVVADEGGWPLSVRQWAEDGTVTYDFHTAPAYHLILGTVFRLFGPVLLVGRAFSAFCGLLSVVLFAIWVRRVLPHGDAWWAVLLFGTLAPLVVLDRRALIEPVALVFVHAAMVCFTSRERWAPIGLAAATAVALLTKANTGAVFGALAIGVLLDRASDWPRRRILLFAFGTGVAMAAAGFLYLFRLDPETFRLGWGQTLGKSGIETPGGVPRLGRFSLPIATAMDTIEVLARGAPLLIGAGLAGAVLALRRQRQIPLALWGITGIPFVLVQVWQSPQYLVQAYPPLVVFAAWATGADAAGRLASIRRRGLLRWLMLAWSLALLARGMLFQRDPSAMAVSWVREQRGPDETVMAAPYVIMQLPAPGISHAIALKPNLLPTPALLAQAQASWIVVDDREWVPWFLRNGGHTAAFEATLGECCTLRFDSPTARVYSVHGGRR